MLRLWTEVQDMWLCLSDIFGTQPKASSDQYSSMKDLSEAGDIKYAEVRCFEYVCDNINDRSAFGKFAERN
jgi:hypothetical protein